MGRGRFFSRQTLLGAWSLGLVAFFGLAEVFAACPPEAVPIAKPTNESGHQAAQALFKAGIDLRDKQDWAGALAFFLQARAIERRVSSTWNAAHCLNLLKRYPEALAFYEEVKRDFSDVLSAAKKAEIEEAIRDLRSKIMIVKIEEPHGIYAIDGEACGKLPRSNPVYVLPGQHMLRVWRAGKPEASVQFQGNPGQSSTVRLPRMIPPKGGWFVQASGGLGVGGSNSEAAAGLSEMSGFLLQTRDGYRFPNQLSLALVMGMFWASPTEEAEDREDLPSGGSVSGETKPYFLRHIPLFGPFMGISAGWEPRVDDNFNALFRTGIGIMGAQSKNVVDIVRGTDRHSIDEEKVGEQRLIEATGRDVFRSVPPYATFDAGLMFHRKQFYFGASVGVFFILDNGPRLPEVPVLFRENGRVNTVTFKRADAYRASFLFVPQLVVGFDP